MAADAGHRGVPAADVRDRDALEALIREVQADLIFHVAAQREPARGGEVHRHRVYNILAPATSSSGRGRRSAPGGVRVHRQALVPTHPTLHRVQPRRVVASSVAGRGRC